MISASSAWSTSLLLKIVIGRLMIEWPSLNLNEFRRGKAIVNYFPRNQASSAVICMIMLIFSYVQFIVDLKTLKLGKISSLAVEIKSKCL